MALLGYLIRQAIRQAAHWHREQMGWPAQQRQLEYLLRRAQGTQFGREYDFASLLQLPPKRRIEEFQKHVPIHDYSSMYRRWWYRLLDGERNVTWPGFIRYFALSSGTTEGASKYIPVSDEMLRAMSHGSMRVLYSLPQYPLPNRYFQRQALLLGGSIHLRPVGKGQYAGDLSGIMAANVPFWFHYFYKPEKRIARMQDWTQKLKAIVQRAPRWSIGTIVAVPPWAQLLLEQIIQHYGLKHIHELWPDFQVLVFGGVSFQPYRETFERLLGRPVHTVETYLASEGYIAYQAGPQRKGLRLLADNGIFFEFIPFDSEHFDDEGQVRPNVRAYTWQEVQEGQEYAIVLSTCAGAWRYLLGDTVRIVDKANQELVITGRTKYYLSVTGEHLSVENMQMAVDRLAEWLQVSIPEFTVHAFPVENFWGHWWYLGIERPIDISPAQVARQLDHWLRELNDDYATERTSALKRVCVSLVPVQLFYEWLEQQGKAGAQHKFPRVLRKQDQVDQWRTFLQTKGIDLQDAGCAH